MTLKGRYVWSTLLVLALCLGLPLLFTPEPGAALVATLDLGRWVVEDISICKAGPAASNGEAWGGAVGPENSDDFKLFHILHTNTHRPTIADQHDILFLDQKLGGTFPPGIGPRGSPGMDVDDTCQFAYIPNFFLHTVIKVDLQASIAQARPIIVWEARVTHNPVDAQLTHPKNQWLLVASWKTDQVTILDTATGNMIKELPSGGRGVASIAVSEMAWTLVLNSTSQDLNCIELAKLSDSSSGSMNPTSVPGLGGFQVLTDGVGRVYVSNFAADTVTVLERVDCTLEVVATIPVGDGPRYMTLSSDGITLYVSNALRADETNGAKVVSMIDTKPLELVKSISVVSADEPAPLGVIALSWDDRYLLVYWPGGLRGTVGQSVIYHYAIQGR